jgi:hypothetical protein
MNLGIGRESMEDLDLAGAFCPIAFSSTGYSTGFVLPAETIEGITSREEQEPSAWEEHSWESYGHSEITALFSPWQLLYLDDALEGTGADVSLDAIELSGDDSKAVGRTSAHLLGCD